MTCSIVARDPVTGDLGVAVQTAMFAVGSIVPWARAGVGAVASQAIAGPAYGPHCLDAVASGASAAEALARAQERDPALFLPRRASWPDPRVSASTTCSRDRTA